MFRPWPLVEGRKSCKGVTANRRSVSDPGFDRLFGLYWSANREQRRFINEQVPGTVLT